MFWNRISTLGNIKLNFPPKLPVQCRTMKIAPISSATNADSQCQRYNIIFLSTAQINAIIRRISNTRTSNCPKSNNMMPPSTALGMDLNNALILPITENKIAENAAIRITCGLVIFVRDMALSLRIGSHRRPTQQSGTETARPSPNKGVQTPDLSQNLFRQQC